MSLSISIRKSSDCIVRVACRDEAGAWYDFSGGSVVAKIRPSLASATVQPFTTSIVYSEERERWEIQLTLTAAQTAALTFDMGVYDVLFTDTAAKKHVVASGFVTVTDIASR
jgi:hypothetical protein